MSSTPQSPKPNAPSPETIARLIDVVGEGHALTAPDAQAPYLTEWRGLYRGRTPLILFPASTAEVSQLLAIANDAAVAIVPQGGNTGLVGAQTPHEDGSEIVVSTRRLNKIRNIAASGSLTAEAGVTLAAVQAAADDHGRLFPLSLASEGSCTIGGNLATNAGGVSVLAYGSARDLVLGIEAVLPDGRIWNGLRALKKDNTGYDLKNLFIGSEGTLAIITAAVLKLFPRPVEQATALVALPSLEAVRALFQNAESRAGAAMTAFEFMSDFSLDLVNRHVSGTRKPFSPMPPWIALVELSSNAADGAARKTLEGILETALDNGAASDAVIAASLKQRQDFWRLREEISDAQRHEGGSIKHDVSVPPDAIPAFIAAAAPIVENIAPGARPVVFGHFGDGNVHYNVTQPHGRDKAEYLKLWQTMNDAVHTLVVDMGGSFSAEHGIGRLKRDTLSTFRSSVELDLMRAIKSAIDPKGIMNPGRIL